MMTQLYFFNKWSVTDHYCLTDSTSTIITKNNPILLFYYSKMILLGVNIRNMGHSNFL